MALRNGREHSEFLDPILDEATDSVLWKAQALEERQIAEFLADQVTKLSDEVRELREELRKLRTK